MSVSKDDSPVTFGPLTLETEGRRSSRLLPAYAAPYQEGCPHCGAPLAVIAARPIPGAEAGVEFTLRCLRCGSTDSYLFLSGIEQ